MEELAKQLQIESVKAYQYGSSFKTQERFMSIVFDKDGKLK